MLHSVISGEMVKTASSFFSFVQPFSSLLQLLCFREDLILGGVNTCQLTPVGAQVAQHCKDWILREIKQCKASDIRLLNSTSYPTVILIVSGRVVLGSSYFGYTASAKGNSAATSYVLVSKGRFPHRYPIPLVSPEDILSSHILFVPLTVMRHKSRQSWVVFTGNNVFRSVNIL